MCYSGKCKYEQYYGDCGWDFNLGNVPLDALCYQQKIYTCLNRESERVKDMKILNKNKKLKFLLYFLTYSVILCYNIGSKVYLSY